MSGEFVRLLFTFPFTHGFDRFGIERPATEAIGTRVSRGPVSYGHGQGTAGIAFVALLNQLRGEKGSALTINGSPIRSTIEDRGILVVRIPFSPSSNRGEEIRFSSPIRPVLLKKPFRLFLRYCIGRFVGVRARIWLRRMNSSLFEDAAWTESEDDFDILLKFTDTI